MRFPRLSHIFHRRARSDGDTYFHPVAPLAPRPRSANGLDELVLATAHGTEVFAPYIPATPMSIARFPIDPAPAPSEDSFSPLSELTQRIRELEAALEFQYKSNRRIPALERALQTERTALQATQETLEKAIAEVSSLRAHLIQTQRALHVAVARGEADDRVQVLAAENTALTAERLRHRKFIELMITVGAHKPVLAQAYSALDQGAEPEAALVAAIKEAVSNPDSVWAALLEPVIGPRTPADYEAQTRCILTARKDARNWRKRAKFWKGNAKKDTSCADLVTPSPSNISSIVEELPDARKRALEELIQRRGIQLNASLAVPDDDREPTRPFLVAAPQPSLPSALATLASSLVSSMADTDEAFAAAPPVQSESTAQVSSSSSSSAYPNLPPLASERFRTSHSMQSQRSSSSFPISASFSRYVAGISRASISASVSGSSATSDISARSKRARIEVVAISQDQFAKDCDASQEPVRPVQEHVDPIVSSFARLPYIEEESSGTTSPAALSSAQSASSSASSAPLHSSRSLSPTPQRPARPDTEDSSDGELVIVMQSDAVRTPLKSRSVPTPQTSPSSRSPDRSRLPVLKKAIRRLSISRPVLVDTTNAATYIFATAKVPKEAKKKELVKKAKPTGEQAKAKAGSPAASPPRPTKIPMGRRIQQMPGDLARRAVRPKTRTKTGSV